MTAEEIKQSMVAALPDAEVEVAGDGQHFFVRVVSASFSGKTRLARHRLIKDALKDPIAAGRLHALSIDAALTPEEYGLLP